MSRADPSLAPVPAPLVREQDGRFYADSRDIASLFEKPHYQVLRDLRALHCSSEFRAANFVACKSNDLTGEFTSHVLMTKDGFAFLAMGYTGAKAAVFKEAYIATFNDMEARIRHQVSLDDPAALRALLLGYTENMLAAQKTIETQEAQLITAAPKVEAFDRLMNADGLIGLLNAGRALGCAPQRFVDWLKVRHLFYQGHVLMPRAAYLEREIFAVKATVIDDEPAAVDNGIEIEPAKPGRTVLRTYITPKGLDYFRTRIPDSIRTKAA